MKRSLVILVSLIWMSAGWLTVAAIADDYFVISGNKANYAPVPKTGQTQGYAAGDDGGLQKGVAWPTPRFTNNNNGTVTDNLTGLIWTKNANCFGVKKNWAEALSAAKGLKSGDHGLTDGSKAGDWRLPNLREFQSLIDYGRYHPPLPAGHPFIEVQMYFYWTSTTDSSDSSRAWDVDIGFFGKAEGFAKANPDNYVWCVRGGK